MVVTDKTPVGVLTCCEFYAFFYSKLVYTVLSKSAAEIRQPFQYPGSKVYEAVQNLDTNFLTTCLTTCLTITKGVCLYFFLSSCMISFLSSCEYIFFYLFVFLSVDFIYYFVAVHFREM